MGSDGASVSLHCLASLSAATCTVTTSTSHRGRTGVYFQLLTAMPFIYWVGGVLPGRFSGVYIRCSIILELMYIMYLILYNDFVLLVQLLCMIPSNIELQIILLTLVPKDNSFVNLLIELSKCFWELTFNAEAVSRLGESKSVSEDRGSARVIVLHSLWASTFLPR